jgi:hypothetical protein
MYEYLSAGTVRRGFTQGNLALINTDAGRFLNVAPRQEAPGQAGGILHGSNGKDVLLGTQAPPSGWYGRDSSFGEWETLGFHDAAAAQGGIAAIDQVLSRCGGELDVLARPAGALSWLGGAGDEG